MRFWEVQKGEVQISGAPIHQINTTNLRELESFVTQETHLFHDSIKNNLRIAKLDATQEELEEACKKASVQDVYKRQAQSGTAEDISQNPHNMFVASFFSSPPLNLVDVLPHIVDGELYFLIDHKGRPQGNYAVSIRAEEYFSKDLAQEGRELTVGIRPDGIRICLLYTSRCV